MLENLFGLCSPDISMRKEPTCRKTTAEAVPSGIRLHVATRGRTTRAGDPNPAETVLADEAARAQLHLGVPVVPVIATPAHRVRSSRTCPRISKPVSSIRRYGVICSVSTRTMPPKWPDTW
ncbi:hypothetical protein GCM10007304_26550 [Rhodococcoides trifolii]|uniref:Uncharacterized protein n=1 Tax=Rhodococcoides trifolii TaxID=908250 RepID=A0A917D4A3_9NOCA|nr:hypothetical protein GCM10007304_26550 [Rhodococcus trifolii]